jgi:hypothetical protein
MIGAATIAQVFSREVQIGTAVLLSQLPPITPLLHARTMTEILL